ncbi:MAG TPA: hypothetical protein VFC13_16565 [Actinomycetes bacterium]|nr:hypothetical protein [Actinomycetes bacterium]
MKRLPLLLLLGGILALGLVGQATAGSDDSQVLEFKTMAPVVSPFTGSTNPVRGINGGGVPWQVASANGELRSDGRLEIKVEGLVIVATGVNPVAAFRGVVNCLTPASPTTGVNLVTDPVPANTAGDAKIEAKLALPTPCIAPIVFVTNGTAAPPGAWFATTGTG